MKYFLKSVFLLVTTQISITISCMNQQIPPVNKFNFTHLFTHHANIDSYSYDRLCCNNSYETNCLLQKIRLFNLARQELQSTPDACEEDLVCELDECCSCMLSRSGRDESQEDRFTPNAKLIRQFVEEKIIQHYSQITSTSKPVVYVSIGSSRLFQDFVIINKLINKGFKNISIHLIDQTYYDLTHGDMFEQLNSLERSPCMAKINQNNIYIGAYKKMQSDRQYAILHRGTGGWARNRDWTDPHTQIRAGYKDLKQFGDWFLTRAAREHVQIKIYVYDSPHQYLHSIENHPENIATMLVCIDGENAEQELGPLLKDGLEGGGYFYLLSKRLVRFKRKSSVEFESIIKPEAYMFTAIALLCTKTYAQQLRLQPIIFKNIYFDLSEPNLNCVYFIHQDFYQEIREFASQEWLVRRRNTFPSTYPNHYPKFAKDAVESSDGWEDL